MLDKDPPTNQTALFQPLAPEDSVAPSQPDPADPQVGGSSSLAWTETAKLHAWQNENLYSSVWNNDEIPELNHHFVSLADLERSWTPVIHTAAATVNPNMDQQIPSVDYPQVYAIVNDDAYWLSLSTAATQGPELSPFVGTPGNMVPSSSAAGPATTISLGSNGHRFLAPAIGTGYSSANEHLPSSSMSQSYGATNTVRFQCSSPGCHKTFRRIGDRNRHEKKHQTPSFKCIDVNCQMKFYRMDKLRDHLRQCHGIAL